jgi:hypothetical protein
LKEDNIIKKVLIICILFTILGIVGILFINPVKVDSKQTAATFEFEGVKVTVADSNFWMNNPFGPHTYSTRPDLGIFIDDEIYNLYLAGDLNAMFTLTHELAHITLRHNVSLDAVIQGDPVLSAQYMENEIAADVWAINHLGLSFNEYEPIRQWLDHEYFKNFLTRNDIAAYEQYMAKDPKGTLDTYGTLQEYLDDCTVKWKELEHNMSVSEKKQKDGVARLLK